MGRVIGLGLGTNGFSVGDLVLPMRRGTWTQFMLADAATAIRLPRQMNAFQAAMLTINPMSAWGMLNSFVRLQKGRLGCAKRGQLRGRTMCYSNRSVPRLENAECSSAFGCHGRVEGTWRGRSGP